MTPGTISTHLSTTLAKASWWDGLWFRENGSDLARDVNALYYFIFWISAAFFVVLMVLMVWFMVRYKRREGVAAEPSAAHNTPLEIVWSVIPSIGFAIMFFWGTWVYLPKTVVPDGAEVINVTAKQWVWNFEYENGATSLQTEYMSDVDQALFAIPAGRPVKFLLTSNDVIHSFYIPEFRVKRDCFPNRYTVAWVEADEATHYFDPDSKLAKPIDKNSDGEIQQDERGYHLYCAEYCGNQHSQMVHRIAVLNEPDYQAWLAQQANTDSIPLVDLGATLYKAKGCTSCHGVTAGARGTGPTWFGSWDDVRPGYTPLNPDENPEGRFDFQYVRQSVLEPQAYYRKGYEGVNMSSYAGQLTEREIRALATYIKSLDPEFTTEAADDSKAEMEAREEGESEGEGQATDENDS